MAPRCESCGRDAESDRIVHGTLLCERCRRVHRVIATAHAVLSWGAAVAIIAYAMPRLIAASGQDGQNTWAQAYLALYAASAIGTTLHECGHAVCARAFGLDVLEVRIGYGRVVHRARVGATRLTFALVPLSGYVSWRPGATARVTPMRRVAIAFSGPLMNLLVAAACVPFLSTHPLVAVPGLCANLLIFLQNMLPTPYGWSLATANDGWHILAGLRNSRALATEHRRMELATACAALDRAGAIAHLRALGGDDPDAEARLCACLLSGSATPEEIDEGFRRSQALVQDRRAHPSLRALALNNRAYMLAVGGWPRTIAEAEWAVREALRINPSNVSFHGTLALVLVRLGRHAEAERLATAVIAARMQALAISPKPALRRSLAENRCTLALLYAHTGRPADARPLFNEALALNDGCLLRGELERTLVAAA